MPPTICAPPAFRCVPRSSESCPGHMSPTGMGIYSIYPCHSASWRCLRSAQQCLNAFGGFPIWVPPNHPKLHHFSLLVSTVLGIPYFKKPPFGQLISSTRAGPKSRIPYTSLHHKTASVVAKNTRHGAYRLYLHRIPLAPIKPHYKPIISNPFESKEHPN